MLIVARRFAAAVPSLLGIALVTFFLVRLIPGDAVDALLDAQTDPVVEAVLRRQLGLDQPIHEQLVTWFVSLARGDLGISFRSGHPVAGEILARLPATLELTIAALIVSLAVAVPAGVISATRRNTPVDLAARGVAMIGLSVPNFWLGILLILTFSVQLKVLPSGGYVPLVDDPGQNIRLLLMPAITLGAALAAVTMRMTRAALLDVLNLEYVRTARSKGLAERTVIYQHAMLNALIPVATIVGIQAARVLGGTVVIEELFSWPGVGSLVVQSIIQRDYALVQGSVLFLAVIFLAMNLVVDLMYPVLDPRLRKS